MKRRAFTLTEMLLVIAIIGIMTGLALSMLAGAVELSREHRTRSIIAKIDQLISEKYEAYRTRSLPLRIPLLGPVDSNNKPTYTDPRTAAQIRLYAMRDLMRMELPDRKSDLTNNPIVIIQKGSPWNATVQLDQPASFKSYRRSAQRCCGTNWATAWTTTYEGSECLYLILAGMQDGEKNALDYFTSDEIGDVDNDGMKEILDAWGNPIEFLRWPAGYVAMPGPDGKWGVAGVNDDKDPAGLVDDIEEAGWPGSDDIRPISTVQNRNWLSSPDRFDPLKADPRWGYTTSAPQPYNLHPLIFSAGRDKKYDVDVGTVVYATTANTSVTPNIPPCDPYYNGGSGIHAIVGQVGDKDGDGQESWADNITNHNPETPQP